MRSEYIVVKTHHTDREGERFGYGIALMSYGEEGIVELDLFADVSSQREDLVRLAKECNDLALAPMHLRDVVEDFIA
ncbi:MAG: hypothetical protein IJW71_00880 [Clostridia bacterium]|nr:hypothetical protein [Clostridia bacterium]